MGLGNFYDTSCENCKCVDRCEICGRLVGDEWMIEDSNLLIATRLKEKPHVGNLLDENKRIKNVNNLKLYQ